MKSLKIKKENNFYKTFKPQLTPKKMLELGVFGGSYFGFNIKEYPKSWFINSKISKNFDVNLNRFKVKSGLSRKEWQKKDGYLNRTRLDGFSGTVVFLRADVFLAWTKFKLKDGRILHDM